MKFVKLIKSSWSVEKINENDWTIKSPEGMYKDENGKEYHFKTKEDALEELDYLRAEHKFDKKATLSEEKENIALDIASKIEHIYENHYNEIQDYVEEGNEQELNDIIFNLSEKLEKISSLIKQFRTDNE